MQGGEHRIDRDPERRRPDAACTSGVASQLWPAIRSLIRGASSASLLATPPTKLTIPAAAFPTLILNPPPPAGCYSFNELGLNVKQRRIKPQVTSYLVSKPSGFDTCASLAALCHRRSFISAPPTSEFNKSC